MGLERRISEAVTNQWAAHLSTMRAAQSLPRLILVLVALSFIAALPLFAQQVVVVELFTSEGCSSCPPAEKAVNQVSSEMKADQKNVFFLSDGLPNPTVPRIMGYVGAVAMQPVSLYVLMPPLKSVMVKLKCNSY